MKVAYCGDNCEACPRYIATINCSKEKLIEAMNLSKKVGWNLEKNDPEEFKCQGCQDIEICEYNVKECCIEKNLDNCGQCYNYPCSRIERAFEITHGYAEKFTHILTPEEYNVYYKAYFLKKENLDKIFNETFKIEPK